MSDTANLRDSLEAIGNMGPLSDRDRTIARALLTDTDGIEDDMECDPEWWGETAIKVYWDIVATPPGYPA